MDDNELEALRKRLEVLILPRQMELVDVRLGPGQSGRTLTVVVDRREISVTMDEIEQVSREISRDLDADDPIDGSYTLEVSSAGLERPLMGPGDFQRFVGRKITLRCRTPIQGRRNFRGRLTFAGPNAFIMSGDGVIVQLPYNEVAKAKLWIDWDEELKDLNTRYEYKYESGYEQN